MSVESELKDALLVLMNASGVIFDSVDENGTEAFFDDPQVVIEMTKINDAWNLIFKYVRDESMGRLASMSPALLERLLSETRSTR